MNLFNRLQLKEKLLVLGVLPAAILAIILSIYFTNTRLNDVDELQKANEQNITITLSKSSVYGVFTGNIELIDSLLESVRENPDIVAVKISNQHGEILSRFKKESSLSSSQNIIHISRPIVVDVAQVNDEIHDMMIGGTKSALGLIGRVTITFSREAAIQRQQSILINSLYLTILLLIGIGLIAYQIGRAIGKPILNLAAAVDSISQGQYSYKAPPTTGNDEVSRLATGVQDMSTELQNHRRQLEAKIADATKELESQNLKLITAQDKIVKAANAKSRFVSHISHEIRTPLNAIIGFLEIIQNTALNTEQKQMVQASLDSSKSLHHIISEVLDIAQLEAHKIRPNKVAFNLEKIAQAAITTLFTQALQKRINLTLQLATTAPKNIYQDPHKIQQVLVNLLSNAIKFSPDGSNVALKIYEDPSATGVLTFEVNDNGVGIDKKDIDSLFDEFSQIGDGKNTQGAGLGLAISNQLVDALGGQLNVESRLDKGSTFRFYIPYQIAPEYKSQDTRPDVISTSDYDLSKLHILVADDNEMNRLLLTKLFERQQISFSVVNNGQEALNLSQTEKFDLLLFDLRMPLLAGNEALDKIREDNNNPNNQTPAIAVTAHITSGVKRANYINNFDSYLTKPIDHAHLFTMINKLVSDSKDLKYPAHNAMFESEEIAPTMLFNLSQALATMNHDKALLDSSIKKFISELPEQLKSIKQAIAINDFDVAADIVHKIHGSAAYCGTSQLKEAAKNFEEMLRNLQETTLDLVSRSFYNSAEELLAQEQQIIIRIHQSP